MSRTFSFQLYLPEHLRNIENQVVAHMQLDGFFYFEIDRVASWVKIYLLQYRMDKHNFFKILFSSTLVDELKLLTTLCI